MAVRIFVWIARVAVLIALGLGLTFWLVNPELTFGPMHVVDVHMLTGLVVTLSLLITSIIMVCTRGIRGLGALGIVYAIIIPVFGLAQFEILQGSLHWIIQIAHMLVGIGALALIEIMARRYKNAKTISRVEERVAQPVRS